MKLMEVLLAAIVVVTVLEGIKGAVEDLAVMQ